MRDWLLFDQLVLWMLGLGCWTWVYFCLLLLLDVLMGGRGKGVVVCLRRLMGAQYGWQILSIFGKMLPYRANGNGFRSCWLLVFLGIVADNYWWGNCGANYWGKFVLSVVVCDGLVGCWNLWHPVFFSVVEMAGFGCGFYIHVVLFWLMVLLDVFGPKLIR